MNLIKSAQFFFVFFTSIIELEPIFEGFKLTTVFVFKNCLLTFVSLLEFKSIDLIEGFFALLRIALFEERFGVELPN